MVGSRTRTGRAPTGAAGGAVVRGGETPSPAQRAYLERGLTQPGGKLPLFDAGGREIAHQTIRACLARGWAEPWFANPIKPDWVIAKLTDEGRRVIAAPPADRDAG